MIGKLNLSEILMTARRVGASDIHLSADGAPLFRVDGNLQSIGELILSAADITEIFAELSTPAQRKYFEKEHDLDFAAEDPSYGRLRIHVYSCFGTPRLAIRLLHAHIPTLETLGVPACIARLLDGADRKHGLILVSGATGQGKSTLLAAMIDHINHRHDAHIVTIEDPVEYRHIPVRSQISHREIGRDVASFQAGILGALRIDPNVIMVGELRSTQAIAAALKAAETGHLVLGTVHSGDAAGTVDRIVDAFDEGKAAIRAQLAASLNAVISLRLLPRAGRAGRVSASEILVANDAVRALLREGKTHQLRNAILTGRAAGMQTLEHALNDLLARREITAETAAAHSSRRDELIPDGIR